MGNSNKVHKVNEESARNIVANRPTQIGDFSRFDGPKEPIVSQTLIKLLNMIFPLSDSNIKGDVSKMGEFNEHNSTHESSIPAKNFEKSVANKADAKLAKDVTDTQQNLPLLK